MTKATKVYGEEDVFLELTRLGQTLTEEDEISWRLTIKKDGAQAVVVAIEDFKNSDRYHAQKLRPGHLHHLLKGAREREAGPAKMTKSEAVLRKRQLEREAELQAKFEERQRDPANWCASFCEGCSSQIEKGLFRMHAEQWIVIKRLCPDCVAIGLGGEDLPEREETPDV